MQAEEEGVGAPRGGEAEEEGFCAPRDGEEKEEGVAALGSLGTSSRLPRPHSKQNPTFGRRRGSSTGELDGGAGARWS